MTQEQNEAYMRWFAELDSGDVSLVGGKNASLGEMLQALKEEGVRVPDGFATTADAYGTFLDANDLVDEIRAHLENLQTGSSSLQETGKAIRCLFRYATFPDKIDSTITTAYQQLVDPRVFLRIPLPRLCRVTGQ